MASHGARSIVLNSRTSKVDPGWIEKMKNGGARVEVFANDSTNREALTALVNHIRLEFPPVAGIAHGAMVLNGTSLFKMPLKIMHQVLCPKVQCAIILDELFQEFFVFFSSVTDIADNREQSAYNAANMFMSSLAAQWRNKGLAASILHIGVVMGVGYVNRRFSESMFIALRKVSYMRMSERGLHLNFGEVILAFNPLSGQNPEIVTGVDTTKLDGILPSWAKFPRFYHCLQMEESVGEKAKKRTNPVSTHVELAEALTEEEAVETMEDAFSLKLQAALQIPPEIKQGDIIRC